SQLRVIGITASNTWGLLLLVLLMGYGLVELPRAHWSRAHPHRALTRALFHCSRLAGERAEAAENLEDLAEEIKKLSEVIKYNHPLRRHLDTIISKFSAPVQESMFRSLEDFEEMEGQSSSLPSLKSLAKTHKQVIKAVQRHHRTELAWLVLVEEALLLQDTVDSSASSARIFTHSSSPSSSSSLRRAVWFTPSVEWWWRCRLLPWLSRVVCVLLSALSLTVVWSECSFFSTKPVLSVFALIISHAESTQNYLAIELMSLLAMAYLSLCTFSTVFRIRLFNLYHLAPHHQTNHHSLLFSGMLFCRLTPPLCLNFLGPHPHPTPTSPNTRTSRQLTR
ncbi:LOW QUALITY PROTEIN: G-protein coupled receptor-associated protein LMBRD2, partial [Lampetra fluviatilis]